MATADMLAHQYIPPMLHLSELNPHVAEQLGGKAPSMMARGAAGLAMPAVPYVMGVSSFGAQV